MELRGQNACLPQSDAEDKCVGPRTPALFFRCRAVPAPARDWQRAQEETSLALDIAVLGEDGSVARRVPLPINAHTRMMQEAGTRKLPLLGRLNDYWGDAVFDVSELAALRGELERLLLGRPGDNEVQALATALIGLVDFAAARESNVHALAD